CPPAPPSSSRPSRASPSSSNRPAAPDHPAERPPRVNWRRTVFAYKGVFVLMLNPSRLSCACTLLLFLLAVMSVGASAQDQSPTIPTALQAQLDRVDVAVSGVGIFNKSSSGTIQNSTQPGGTLTINPGNTLGALVTVRYVAKPRFGLEFNYGCSRYTQKFSTIGGGQNNA